MDKLDFGEDVLAESMSKYLEDIKKLVKENPQEAKKRAIKDLIASGIIDENGNFRPPYNKQEISNDFTYGPKVKHKMRYKINRRK